MALHGLVDPRVVIAGAAARFSNTISGMDRWLRAFESLCQRAGPQRCTLAGAAPRATRLRHAPIPALGASPPGALSYGDLSAGLAPARAVLAATRSAAGDSQTAITCTDSTAREGLGAWSRVIARLARVSRWAGPFVGWSNWAPCASWRARAADRYTGPWNAPTKNPILVTGTTSDPATPYANARRVARLLGNAILLTHTGYGHTSEADPSICVTDVTSRYLVDLITPPMGTVCSSDRQPFDQDFGR